MLGPPAAWSDVAAQAVPASAASGPCSFNDAGVTQFAQHLADVFVADAGGGSFDVGEGEGVADVRANECLDELGFGAAAGCDGFGSRFELPVGGGDDAEEVGEPGAEVMLALVPTFGRASKRLVVGLFALFDQLLA